MSAKKKKLKPKQKKKPKETKLKRKEIKPKKVLKNLTKKQIQELQSKLEELSKKPETKTVFTTTEDIDEVTAPKPKENTVSPAEYDCIVAALKNPKLNNRHKLLSLIHNRMVGLEVLFQREIFDLEDRYLQEYYTPLQKLRRVLLEASDNGDQALLSEKELVENCKPGFSGDSQKFTELQLRVGRVLSPSYRESSEVCKDFWLIVLLHSDPLLRDLIQPSDIQILKFLIDIRTEPVRLKAARQFPPETNDDVNCDVALGYDLLFKFLPNPYFSNPYLTKRYLIDVMPDQCDYVIAPHGDVLAGGWTGSTKIDIEMLGEECKDSILCQTILNQDHSVDKILDYNGPQVISIRGCQIKWRTVAEDSQMKLDLGATTPAGSNVLGCCLSHKFDASSNLMQGEGLERVPCLFEESSPPLTGSLDVNDSFTPATLAPSSAPDNVESKPQEDLQRHESSFNLFTPLSSPGSSFFSESNTSLHSGSSHGSISQKDTVFPRGNSDTSTAKSLFPFLVPKAPINWISKLKKQQGMPSSALRGDVPPNPSLTSSSNARHSVKSNVPRKEAGPKQFPFPTANRYSCASLTGSSSSGTGSQMHISSRSDVNTKPSSKNANTASATSQKSFFDFFEIMWNEKSPDHCKEVARDYQIGSYIRDVIIPRAYVFYRQKDLTDQDKECQDRHVFTSLGNRYEKEFKLPIKEDAPADYDDIDDEIPLAVSQQALKTIETSKTVKKEIIANNKTTATRIANSFIGKMLRRHDDETDDVDDDAGIPSKKCRSSICDRKMSSHDSAMTSKKSHKTESMSFFHRIHSKLSPIIEQTVKPSKIEEVNDEVFEEAPEGVESVGACSSSGSLQKSRMSESSRDSPNPDDNENKFPNWPDLMDKISDKDGEILLTEEKSKDIEMNELFGSSSTSEDTGNDSKKTSFSSLECVKNSEDFDAISFLSTPSKESNHESDKPSSSPLDCDKKPDDFDGISIGSELDALSPHCPDTLMTYDTTSNPQTAINIDVLFESDSMTKVNQAQNVSQSPMSFSNILTNVTAESPIVIDNPAPKDSDDVIMEETNEGSLKKEETGSDNIGDSLSLKAYDDEQKG